jgi:soluble lytic murein transglycosylase-like protein
VQFTDRYGLTWSTDGLRELARAAAVSNGIPPDGLIALLEAESGWDPNVVSSAGAEGIAQFMPPTSAEWGVDPWDPPDAISGAARYLAWLRKQVDSWPAALASYNWGIGNVAGITTGGVFDLAAAPVETRNYVARLAPAFGWIAPAPAAIPASSPPALALKGGLLIPAALFAVWWFAR